MKMNHTEIKDHQPGAAAAAATARTRRETDACRADEVVTVESHRGKGETPGQSVGSAAAG